MVIIQETTIDSVLCDRARVTPSHVAIRCGDTSTTFAELAQRAEQFARWLIESGVEPGDRVAVWLPNGVPWVVVYIAVSLAGAVSVPVSTKLVEREVGYILDHSESKVVVVPKKFLGRDYVSEASRFALDHPEVTVLATDATNVDLPVGPPLVTPPGSQPADAGMIQYTSGTTGFPKGCVLSHRSWTNNARLSAEVADITPEDVILCPSPFFHLFGSLTGLMGALSVGAMFVTQPTVVPIECIRAIQKHSVTRLVAVPTVWLDLMQYAEPTDIPTVRGGVWGGASFPRTALERALSEAVYGWDLQCIYGMTEAPTLTQTRPGDPPEQKINSVGQPTPGVGLRIVSASTGHEVAVGEIGEIWARGYNRMIGYLKDPAATEARFAGEWIRSGDLGMIDQAGYLHVTGRLTDMILVGGANVYAREVEDVLLAIDGILMAAVVGRHDNRLGEVPIAWVVPRHGVAIDKLTLLDHCERNLAKFKVPRDVFIVPEMPLTGSGKIHKALLRQRANTKAD